MQNKSEKRINEQAPLSLSHRMYGFMYFSFRINNINGLLFLNVYSITNQFNVYHKGYVLIRDGIVLTNSDILILAR